jgi:hypothetical protein
MILLYPSQVEFAVKANNAQSMKAVYDLIIRLPGTSTKADLMTRGVFVNGYLGSPCEKWPIAFYDERPFILKPLGEFERRRGIELRGIVFDSPHVVKFVIFDVDDSDEETAPSDGPPLKRPALSNVDKVPNMVMLLPMFPITMDHMPPHHLKSSLTDLFIKCVSA